MMRMLKQRDVFAFYHLQEKDMIDRDDYLQRAINHYYKTSGVQASESLSECDHGDTESIVTLRNVNGDLAKYVFDKATDKMRPE